MNQIISNLLVYGQLPKDSILWQLADICEKLKSGTESRETLRTRVFGQVKNLLTVATDYAFDKNLWHNYLTFLLASHENAYSTACEILPVVIVVIIVLHKEGHILKKSAFIHVLIQHQFIRSHLSSLPISPVLFNNFPVSEGSCSLLLNPGWHS